MDYEVAPQSGIPLRCDFEGVTDWYQSTCYRELGARATGAALGIKSIWNSTWRTGGRPGKSLGKTSRNPLTTTLGHMIHLVASTKLDSARSYVMHGAFLTQGKASIIPTVFSWGGSISLEGFLPSILLLAVIIVAVAIVVMVILVVVDVIIGLIIIGGEGDLVGLFYSNRLGVYIPPGQGVIGREKVEEDDRPQACFLGGKLSSGWKKSQELSDGDNIGDGGKIVGGAIGACGQKASEAKRSLVKSFEGSREVFPDEARK
uniref:Uncharacterized protein n=1 Tax=Tanacetum cinerariifolium TaxID=118510 RepID=A0A6L2K3C6_TANCI|nr:hypothetical protein [Tanacetum cinerariifolium]